MSRSRCQRCGAIFDDQNNVVVNPINPAVCAGGHQGPFLPLDRRHAVGGFFSFLWSLADTSSSKSYPERWTKTATGAVQSKSCSCSATRSPSGGCGSSGGARGGELPSELLQPLLQV
eukprot:gnl/Hemi2/21229_TR7042_c0_g1_i1.p1 gnl/Hemi2/21229_TR7042_c0_g1~~gnl/Hemi2/21229_TR7042_c0_g1_i1.p1  ORF type:complete len:117 (+),score=17.38 gnl/Hemi2/21229_TR7042_c0_g1_i1:150-500(+)